MLMPGVNATQPAFARAPNRCALCAGKRGLGRKAKALNRQEFVVVGWSDPEGSRPHLGELLLGYYTGDGKLIYAGRVGTPFTSACGRTSRRRMSGEKDLDVLPRRYNFSPCVLRKAA
jgi:hypothetical protein